MRPLEPYRKNHSVKQDSHAVTGSPSGRTSTAPLSTSAVAQTERMTLSRAHSGGSITIMSQLGTVPLPLYLNPVVVRQTRPPTTPTSVYPLPLAWSPSHDRAICILDANDHSLAAIVLLVKRMFPELASATLTLDTLERRLKTLDQNVELDYWAVALRYSDQARSNEMQLIETV